MSRKIITENKFLQILNAIKEVKRRVIKLTNVFAKCLKVRERKEKKIFQVIEKMRNDFKRQGDI